MRPWLIVLGIQLYLFSRYARLDAEFHYWLHGLAGAALGVGLLTAAALVRGRSPGGVWVAGLAGALYSATPDILFIALDRVHEYWMDAFALHIGVHFVPAPLATAFALFAAALCAWAAATLGHRRLGAALLALTVGLASAALLTRDPIPTTLDQLRAGSADALLCRLPERGVIRASLPV
ncbi:MAG: hypothetical protein ACRDZO_25950 [Egibacteraceae bacterium]